MKFVKVIPKEEHKKLLEEVDSMPQFKSIPKGSIMYAILNGVNSVEDLNYFFFGSYDDLHDVPMGGQRAALDYLIEHKHFHYVVMGDYDTDGCMATAVMVLGLRKLGYKVDYYMNSRFVDGYGLKPASVKEIRKRFPSVNCIITVDNGIVAYEGIEYAYKMGIEVIVTDHHNPKEKQPDCVAVIDPKQDWLDNYPFREICGAVVAWKLVKKLHHRVLTTPNEKFLKQLLVYAGVATVGDQMLLVNENRIIVKHAVEYLNSRQSPLFFKALKKQANLSVIDEETIGFYISPMINAMGRLTGNPISIIDAITLNEEDEVLAVCEQLILLNNDRKKKTSEQVAIATEYVNSLDGDETVSRCIVTQDESFDEGIVGLIAGRVTEKFYKPSFSFSKVENGVCKGSGRSIVGIDLMDILYHCSDLVEQFGGHTMAAGLTIKPENIQEFRIRTNKFLETYDEDVFVRKVPLHFKAVPNDVNFDLVNVMNVCRPYGQGFRRPLVLLNNYSIDWKRTNANKAGSCYVGATGNTLRLVEQSGLVAIGFNATDRFRELEEPNVCRFVGFPSINTYNGIDSVQFVIEKDYVYK